MRVLGIDPGTVRMGVGVVDGDGRRGEGRVVAFESVALPREVSVAERLKVIRDTVAGYIGRFRPEVMALENVFFGENVRTLVKIGEARASAMLAAAEQGVPVVEYPPARVKQAVTGNGTASKVQVQQMVKVLLQIKEAPPVDAADALAVALCHLQSLRRLDVRVLVR